MNPVKGDFVRCIDADHRPELVYNGVYVVEEGGQTTDEEWQPILIKLKGHEQFYLSDRFETFTQVGSPLGTVASEPLVTSDKIADGTVESVKKGKRYNNGKLRWRNFPLFLVEPLIEVAAKGEDKYETFNFLIGQYVNDNLDSLKRHLMLLESPFHPDIDEESGCHHAAHIAWNALTIIYNLKHREDLDDRWSPADAEDEK